MGLGGLLRRTLGFQAMEESFQQLNGSLYELYKPVGTPTMQVLFFHGLSSDDLSSAHFLTWKTEDDSCIWPQTWLPEKFPGAHILTVSYGELARIVDMYVTGENLISDLMQEDIGQECPVILVGHCIGGLVIKEICCHAHWKLHSNKPSERQKRQLETFLKNVRGILYYSTPHHGSSVIAKAIDAPLFKYFKSLYNEAERLNSRFEDLQMSQTWEIYGLGESLETSSGLFKFSDGVVVPEASSRYGPDFYTVPADHNSICRPRNKKDRRFCHLTHLIKAVTTLEVETQVHQESSGMGVQQDANNILANPTNILKNERFYVPIQRSHFAVIAAIEEFRGPHVILLHGGVGKGKSTLARYMFERYGQDGDCGNQFEHVIWASCANCSVDEASGKQFQILQDHAPNSLLDSMPKEAKGPKPRIRKAYRDFLIGNKILMILDDVSDPRFLNEMWMAVMGAKNVKYLVTSQRANICNSLKNDALLIAMEDPTQDETRNILASLVGLHDKIIPGHLQEIADKIIETTERNPLALACLASHFAYSQDNQDERAWQDAHAGLRKLLDNPEENIVLGNTESAPRSLWAAMKICIGSLDTMDAKSLLSLVYACKGEIVPEIVLKIWHASLKSSSCPFTKSKDELVMRELVKVISQGTEAHDNRVNLQGKGQILLSLRSLVKLYMEQHMAGKEEIKSAIGELIGNEDVPSESGIVSNSAYDMEAMESGVARLSIVLCILYFDRHHIDRIVTSAITQARNQCEMADLDDENADLQRLAIEPMIWLLNKPCREGEWTQSDVGCVEKVLLTYICKRQLDDNNISQLLKLDACSQAQLATLEAIRKICSSEEKPLLKENNLNFLQAILHLTDSNYDHSTSVQMAAFRTLGAACDRARQEGSIPLVLDSPGVLDILVSALSVPDERPDLRVEVKRDTPSVQKYALFALTNLLYTRNLACGSSSIKHRIANHDGALVVLVKLLSVHDRPSVQESAGRALINLTDTSDDSLLRQIADQEGALVGLVKCLAADEHPGVQESGAWALANLANGNSSIKRRIANQDGAFDGLVKLLSAHDRPSVQEEVARALCALSCTNDASLMGQIANQEGALVGLVDCLAADEHPGVQKHGALALANLAQANSSIKDMVANQDGALVGLVKLLSAHDRPGVQEEAARALVSLSYKSDASLQRRIGNQEGALVGLVECLAANEHPGVQKNGAWALANLAVGDSSMKLRVANQDGALVGLVKLLSAHDRPSVQEDAAWALANLANGNSSIKRRVANQDGALVGLVKLLSMHDRPCVQEQAGRALINLAGTDDDSLMRQITDQEGVLVGLVECLAADEHPGVQQSGASALANLANGNSSIKRRIANQDGAFDGLVKLLSAHDRPRGQEHAEHAITNLGYSNYDFLHWQIGNEEWALAGLAQCFAMKDQPALQEHVASALVILANSQEARTLLGKNRLFNGLKRLLKAGIHPNTQNVAARALTLMNFPLGKQASLKTAEAYLGRAEALNLLQMHAEALADLDKAVKLQKEPKPSAFSKRCFTRTKIGDLTGALEDANEAVKCSDSSPFALQERGILKRITEDLKGALADLNEGLNIETDDYESLKHRGFVKFLLKDEEGARADAELAMRIKPLRVDGCGYERGDVLGAIPVEYLGYKLK